MTNIQNADGDFRYRFRLIIWAQRMRRPLAGMTILLTVIGLVEAYFGVDVLLRPNPNVASTHPLTGVSLIALSLGVLSFRPQQPTPAWRYAMSGTILTVLLVVLGARLAHQFGVDVGPLVAEDGFAAGVGSDTAIILALLFASAIVRRHAGRWGLAIALVAASGLVCAFIALSFGQSLFEGQMAVATLVALVPITLAVLTLYAHRPFARVLLLSGPVGYRTRQMMVVGFVIPWLGGLILHRVVGVPERMVPAEAMIIGVIILSMCAVAVFSGFQHERVDRARRKLSEELRRIAVEDQLTGVLNRTGIKNALHARWEKYRADGTAYHVILFDLDHFKLINDTFGHDTGDRVLSAVGSLLKPLMRRGDVMGRWGGEEFLVIAEARNPGELSALADRLRAAISDRAAGCARLELGNEIAPLRVTASFGVATFLQSDTADGDAVKRADIALYRAKDKGRNRVCFDAKVDDLAA